MRELASRYAGTAHFDAVRAADTSAVGGVQNDISEVVTAGPVCGARITEQQRSLDRVPPTAIAVCSGSGILPLAPLLAVQTQTAGILVLVLPRFRRRRQRLDGRRLVV